jgi:hypothetical protein
MPLEDLLPDHLPAFVRSPAYFFGVITLSSLVLLILSGIVLAVFGPQWWHDNAVGHFVNSLHFWCAEAFFFSLTLHLWTEFFKAGLALALYLLVPDPAVQYLVELGYSGLGNDGGAHRPVRCVPLPALPQSPAVLPRRPPPDLARVLS